MNLSSTPAEIPVQPEPLHPSFSGVTIDAVSKGIAVVAFILYACGYLIVSLSLSRYGVMESNPLRPRILAAGAWFMTFTSVPAIIIYIGVRKKNPSLIVLAQASFVNFSCARGFRTWPTGYSPTQLPLYHLSRNQQHL